MPAGAIPEPGQADPLASLTERFKRTRLALEAKLAATNEEITKTKSAVSGFAKSAADSGGVKLSSVRQAFTEEEIEKSAEDDCKCDLDHQKGSAEDNGD